MRALLCLLFAALTVSAAARASPFDVRAFGAVGDGRANDQPAIQRAIDAAIHAGKGAEIVLPAGSYRLGPSAGGGRAQLKIEAADSLTLRGEGKVLLVSEAPTQHIFDVERSSGVRIEHLAMDRHPLLFSQGVVRAIDAGRKTAIVRIDPGYDPLDAPLIAAAKFLIVFSDPASGSWGNHDAACAFYKPDDPTVCWPPTITSRRRLPDSSWEVTLNTAPEPNYVGKRAVIWSRQYKGAGFFFRGSRNISVENVAYYGGGDDGFIVVHCSGKIVFRHFSIGVPPASDRLFAGADGAMVFNNHAELVLDDVSITRVWDDDINIGANYARIFSRSGPRTLDADGTRADFQIGDQVAVLDWATKIESGRARITSLNCAAHGYPVCTIGLDKAVVVAHTGFAEIKPHGNDTDGIDRMIDLDGAGRLTTEGSRFQSLGGRCLLIKTSDSVVKDSSCSDTVLAGIVVGPSFFWDEGPQVHDVSIVNDTFDNVSGPNILVSDGGGPNAAGARGIAIVSNVFLDFGHYKQGVLLRSASPVLLQKVGQITFAANRVGSKYSGTLPPHYAELSGSIIIR